jgi:hypothetical protein
MPEIGTSGSMSGDGKRSDWHSLKPPRPSSTLRAQPGLQRATAGTLWSMRHHPDLSSAQLFLRLRLGAAARAWCCGAPPRLADAATVAFDATSGRMNGGSSASSSATDRVRSSRIEVAFTKLCRRAFVRPCAWGSFERQSLDQEPKPGHGNVHALFDATLWQLLQSAACARAACS